jgi:hypothetical protein
MRRLFLSVLVITMVISSVYGSDRKQKKVNLFRSRIDCLDNVDISIDDGSVIIYPEDDDDEYVEITEEYKLYINDRRIKTNTRERELLADYHSQVYEIVDEAKRIGWKGAQVGVSGAKLGVKAVVGVFKLILPGYGSDDLERDLEREAAKIEAKAERLEEEAEEIEELADELEDMHYELKRQIHELRRLGWF